MKKFLLLLFIAVLACPGGSALSAPAQAVKFSWNGTPITFTGASPVQEGKTWLVPIRPVAEELGAELKWNAKGKELTLSTFARTAILVIGSKQMKVNEQTVALPTAPKQHKSAILVPVEALEAIGLEAAWNPAKTAVDLKPEFTVVKKYVFPIQVASVRYRGQYEEITKVFTLLDHEVKDVINGKGMSLYYEQNYEQGHDTEICIPVSKSVEGKSIEYNGQTIPIVTRTLEGGYFLSVVHQGTPDTLGDVWAQMDLYAKNTRVELTSPSREVYVQEDLKDYRKQVTEIQLRFKDL
ncbi:hypothetical protein J7E73_21890 [Paenibacillus albidus]|uniref:stalk domain-containing protein n=1 Tax=Paenibacillus albidus TaxID=2041023 RepID=UPI001BE56DB0|nr:stalk domain-containing protein [Paenibacillus albidus]MBT2291729.1 hypothetical protein [Paenibacillus albidus]